ncbi:MULTISPECIES: YceH family protein [unclassified Lentimonas]|uniref:YceH family protein n=1 Tax=unclassified Lentimonas TaxID=2630993 RepID=UPI0013281CCE|nr:MULTISPECIES: YceH family protein [unclassified Lentimonas]CAA6679282.1 Protein of unknown function YceH [Lentimonas sp. CC4]CAA6686316.1 Protein of unknown function YceH [Lentimonas sp. CC6]CAA7076092.1 Protein of unknown function YceH [Lentimonas sp. CC4]CAA7170915.1 Protein of unknown function YceH [Lentimonas sp. CC21]CAA7181142.1 Protein of unknown function YceH [Lentimonas sp. CC8]
MQYDLDDTPLILTPAEARVLGCLMEKSVTTPDIYPLSFNGLITACNQKTNRNPVVEYDDEIVAEAVEGLREKHLLYRVDGAGSRVQKYKHRVDERFGIVPASQALLTVLLLRGPQTGGELRTRSERMHSFANTEAVDEEITSTTEDLSFPLWRRLPQAPGQKEARYMHLLFGEEVAAEVPTPSSVAVEPAVASVQQRNERIAELEGRVDQLESELAAMQAAFAEFRTQFD